MAQLERVKGGGGVWPSSPRMVDDGGSGGVRWGPELLSRRRWMGGVKGGAVEERTCHAGVDERDGTVSGRRLLWWPGGATETKGQGVRS
jgi:hypothetical protein